MSTGFFRRRLVTPLIDLLRQGITPEKLALSVALGITLGVTPVLGSTTILCAVAAAMIRLNLPAIQAVNYLVYPLQLALLVPFVRLGEWIFSSPPFPISVARIYELMQESVWQTIVTFWNATLHGLAAWAVLAVPSAGLIYAVLLPVLRRMNTAVRREAL